MTQKSTKSRLLLSALSLLVCISMFVGSTFAWFTDSVSSVNNIIKSGNLDVEVEYSYDGETWTKLENSESIFKDTLWEPGHTQAVALRVSNVGSLALKYSVATNIVSEKTGINVYGKEFKLSEVLKLGHSAIQQDGQVGDIYMGMLLGKRDSALQANWIGFGAPVQIPTPELLPGAAHVMVLVITMPETVGNEANHKTNEAGEDNQPKITFGVTVNATQLMHEEDSFGKDYDEDADYAVDVSSVEELAWALKKGGNVVLAKDITITTADLINDPNLASIPVGLAVVDTNVVLDLNGNSITVADYDSTAIYVKDGNLTIVGDGEIKNTAQTGYVVWAKGNSTVNVQGGDFFAGGDDTTLFYASGAVAFDPNSPCATINIYGGNFDNEAPGDSVQDYLNVQNHGCGRINIYGGTFDFHPVNTDWGDDKAYIKVPFGCEVTDNGDGTYTVARSKNITLTEDMDDEVVIDAEADMTLDLAGNTLNNTLTNNGDVTVEGGAINTTGNNALYNEGSAELKDVTVNMTGSTGYVTNSRTEDSVTVFENVTATSTGGGINVWQGEAVFKSGTITTNSTSTSARHVFYVANGAKLTIEDGEFFFNPTNLTRKGSYICAQQNATVIVKGGKFHKPSTRTAPIQAIDGSTVTIYGGTFQFDPSAFVADGYEAVEGTDGWWTVSKK